MIIKGNETKIRVEHRDGSVGMLLTDIDGVGTGPDTTGAETIPVRWLSGPRAHTNPAWNDTFNRVDMITACWSVDDPSFRLPV